MSGDARPRPLRAGALRRTRAHPRDRLRSDLAAGGGVVGGYRLEAVIGRGATGTVYRARRVGDATNRLVAVKRAPSGAGGEAVGRLQREAEALASLDHPHVVRVLELVPDGDGAAIVMQLAAGGSLADRLAHSGPLPAEEVVRVAAPLADALASAHRRGLVHGDVKPANILFTSEGEPLLSDFGASRRLGPGDGDEAMGTVRYVDPAVLQGASPDERSDVYSLGAVCHEMLTGSPPGTGDGATAISAAPRVPQALVDVVKRALAPGPADRYQGADVMAESLRAAVGAAVGAAPARPTGRDGVGRSDGAGPSPPSPPGPPTRSFGPRPPQPEPAPAPSRRGRSRTLVASAALTLVAVAVAAVVSAAGGRSRPEVLACPPAPAPLQADVDGDGCPSAARWSGNILEVEGRRYQLGEPGDAVLLGDWDCDGRDTPALYRPGGAVFFFDGWAQDGRPLPAASRGEHLPEGQPEVRRGEDGCDRLVVR